MLSDPSAPREITMPTLEAFDAEFGLERTRFQSTLARFLPLAGLVLAAVGLSAALLWGSVDRQVWYLLTSRAVEGWRHFRDTENRELKQQVDSFHGEIDTPEPSRNELASAQQPLLGSISTLEGDRRNYQQRYSIASRHNWYDDWNSLFYRTAIEPTGGRTASPQTPGAARPAVQSPVPPRNNVSAPLSLASP
jgi:hypothetical protein